jgi:hypothetical protein
LSVALLRAFLPLFSTQYLSADWRQALFPSEENWFLVGIAAGSALSLVDAWLLALAIA